MAKTREEFLQHRVVIQDIYPYTAEIIGELIGYMDKYEMATDVIARACKVLGIEEATDENFFAALNATLAERDKIDRKAVELYEELMAAERERDEKDMLLKLIIGAGDVRKEFVRLVAERDRLRQALAEAWKERNLFDAALLIAAKDICAVHARLTREEISDEEAGGWVEGWLAAAEEGSEAKEGGQK